MKPLIIDVLMIRVLRCSDALVPLPLTRNPLKDKANANANAKYSAAINREMCAEIDERQCSTN